MANGISTAANSAVRPNEKHIRRKNKKWLKKKNKNHKRINQIKWRHKLQIYINRETFCTQSIQLVADKMRLCMFKSFYALCITYHNASTTGVQNKRCAIIIVCLKNGRSQYFDVFSSPAFVFRLVRRFLFFSGRRYFSRGQTNVMVHRATTIVVVSAPPVFGRHKS